MSLALRDAQGARTTVSFTIDGARPGVALSGDAPLPGVVNRYVGKRDGWQSNVATFARVVAEQVRPGIDVINPGNQRQLEYDFVIAPGADVAAAGMLVTGAERVDIDRATGDLLLHVGSQVLRQQAPVAYQERTTARAR